MSIVSPPAFHSLAAYEYPARSFRRVFQSMVGDREGVFGADPVSTELQVAPTTPASMSVRVLAGRALINGDAIARQGAYFVENDAAITIGPLASASSGTTRIDRIVLEDLDSSADGGSAGSDLQRIRVISGATVSDPAAPSAPAVPAGAIPLAQVQIKGSTTSIIAANTTAAGGSRITDLRPRVTPPAFLDLSWKPSLTNGAATSWALVGSDPDLLVNVPAPGWIEASLVTDWGFSSAGNTREARIVPLTATYSGSDLIDPSLENVADLEGAEDFGAYDNGDRTGAYEHVAVHGAWYVPGPRALRLALQYQVSASNLYLNTRARPVVVRFTPDLGA